MFRNTAAADELKRAVFEVIRERPHGITRRALQKRLGISDPALEQNRDRVWKLCAAIAALLHEGSVLYATEESDTVLYPQVA